MAAVAAYARSDQGRLYGAICERYGVDPAASFSDDVLALNFRAVLATEATPEPDTTINVELEAEWLRLASESRA